MAINFLNTVAVDENVLFVDTVNDRVGIGTASPDRKLTIGGIGNTGDGLKIEDPTNTAYGAHLTYYDAGSEVWLGGITNSVYNQTLSIHRDATRTITINSSNNVGIGTTSPSAKLDVAGNIKIQSALLSNQENTDIDTGVEVVAQVAHATYTAAFFDFVVKKGTNVRSGTVYACHNGDTTPLVEFTETSTNDLGDTSDVTLSVDISGANMRLLATVTSDDWSVKSLIRAI